MRNPRLAPIYVLILALVILSACGLCPVAAEDRIRDLGPPLTKLAAAADADAGMGQGGDLSDEEFLRRAEPDAYPFFVGYKLKVQRKSGHAVVLVCDSEGKRALLEDAGWTGPLEHNHYLVAQPKPCEFTITIEDGGSNR